MSRLKRLEIDFRTSYQKFRKTREEHQKMLKAPSSALFGHLFALISAFERLAAVSYQIRLRAATQSPLRQQAEQAVLDGSQDLLLFQKSKSQDHVEGSFFSTALYRHIWLREFPLFCFITALFAASGFVGWSFAMGSPQYVGAILPHGFIERIMDNEHWFESLRDNPLMGGFGIAVNNIKVSIACFLGGALFGMGGLGVLLMNGLFFGAVLGFCRVHGMDAALTDFVVAHGPLELTVIVASCFASMVYGRVFFMRPYTHFGSRFAQAVREACVVLWGILPWLVLAAFFEGFVSPFDFFSFEQKLGMGSLLALLFWLWTFWPRNKAATSVSTPS